MAREPFGMDLWRYQDYKIQQEVYRKAKTFDEILNITQLQHEEEYADDVISVIDKYKEDKQND